AADEMARANAPAPINGLGVGFIGPTIVIHGTPEQKQRYLRKILTAEEMWCQLYSEPNSGSDLASLRTRAEDRGDHFLVHGQRIRWGAPSWGTSTRRWKYRGTPPPGCCPRSRRARLPARRRRSPSSPTASSRSATTSSASRSSAPTAR